MRRPDGFLLHDIHPICEKKLTNKTQNRHEPVRK